MIPKLNPGSTIMGKHNVIEGNNVVIGPGIVGAHITENNMIQASSFPEPIKRKYCLYDDDRIGTEVDASETRESILATFEVDKEILILHDSSGFYWKEHIKGPSLIVEEIDQEEFLAAYTKYDENKIQVSASGNYNYVAGYSNGAM